MIVATKQFTSTVYVGIIMFSSYINEIIVILLDVVCPCIIMFWLQSHVSPELKL